MSGVATAIGASGLVGAGASMYNASQMGGSGFQYPNADEIYGKALGWANNNFPTQMGAQTGALQQLATPQSTQAYYAGFQPTSFEQALGNQSFQNIWPNQQAYMNNALSKSGMMYSPVAATTLGNAYGNLATNIGQYLNTQGNNRANTSLQARLGIDPMSYLGGYANTAVGQGNNQTNANYAQSMASLLGQQQGMQQAGSGVGTALGYYLQNQNQNQAYRPAVSQDAYQTASLYNGLPMGFSTSQMAGMGNYGNSQYSGMGGPSMSSYLGQPQMSYANGGVGPAI